MELPAGDICIPGDKLADNEEYEVGYGTYERFGCIYASLVGIVEVSKPNSDKKCTVSVKPKRKAQSIPNIGSIVTCKITQLTSRSAKCQILSIDNHKETLTEPLRGLIRKEDVRSMDRDRIEMHKCFRPGDFILAKVLSLGDAACYLLTTAEPELGVVVARGEKSNVAMIPLTHALMQCPVSSMKEPRKVARPQPQHINFIDQQQGQQQEPEK